MIMQKNAEQKEFSTTGATEALKTAKAIDNLKSMKAALIDKDGPLLNIKLQLHENMRLGFERQQSAGTGGMKFDYSPDTTYLLRGIRSDYNGGIKPILALMAINQEAAVARVNGMAPDEKLRRILASAKPAERLDTLISIHANTKEAREIAQDIYMGDGGKFFTSTEAAGLITPINGAREAYLELEERYDGKIGIVTSTPTRKVLERDLAIIFRESEIHRIKVICREDVSKPKPDPEGAFRMMEIIGAMPAKTYMVGDAVVDIKTAQNAGIMPVGVLSGMASHDHLSSEGASMIFESMSHLASLLRCQS